MKELYTVSIIVPIYNIESYLVQCIQSLIKQTYKKIEIILVDDESTDNSGKICDIYANRDNRIRVIHKANGGVSSSREAGISAATGEYIMFADGDDWIDMNTVECCMRNIYEDDSIDCVMFSYIKEFPKSSVPVHIMDKSIKFSPEEAEDKVYRRLFGLSKEELKHPERMDNIGVCWGKMYKAEVAKKGRYFDNRIVGSAEDALFNMYALYKCGKVVYIDKCFYHYRKINTSFTNAYRKDLEKKWGVLFKTMSSIIDEKKLPAKYKDALSNRIALSIIGIGMNEVGNKKIKPILRYEKIKSYLRQKNYRKACKKLPLYNMPFIWKIFFLCCKLRITPAVYIMLLSIMFLRKHG